MRSTLLISFLFSFSASAGGALTGDQFYGTYSGITEERLMIAGNEPMSFSLEDLRVTLTHSEVGYCEKLDEPYLVYSKPHDGSEFLESENIVKISSNIYCKDADIPDEDKDQLQLHISLEDQVLDGTEAKGTLVIKMLRTEEALLMEKFAVTKEQENLTSKR